MVSNIGDGWRDSFPKKWPQLPQWPQFPTPLPHIPPYQIPSEVTREEIEALRKEMEELKRLLQAAKRFDESTGQPHCEIDEKVAMVKAVGAAVGVDMQEVFEQP